MDSPVKTEVADAPATIVDFVRESIEGVDRFFFRPSSPATLGLLRLIGGLAIFYIIFCYSFDLESVVGRSAWFDEARIKSFREEDAYAVPANNWDDGPQIVHAPQSTFSIYFHVNDPIGIWVVHIGSLAVILMFALGLWTRITSVLTWIATLSYIQRSPYHLFGMDTMSNILILYMMLAPCDKAFSLDSLFERLRRRKAGDPNWNAPPAPLGWATFISRCMQIHFCIIYFAAGTSKLLGSSWWSGNALWYVFANNEFTPMENPLYFETLKFLTQHRYLWEIALTSCTVYTLILELALPFLIWYPRWRWVMMSGSILLHLGIGIFMGLKLFSILMILLVSSFLPPEVAEWIRLQCTGNLGFSKDPESEKGEIQSVAVKRSAVA